MIDLKKLENVEIQDVKMYDYPDFCDAFISYAEIDGIELTDEQYDYVNEQSEYINDLAHESLH